jgi:hypothetical protein
MLFIHWTMNALMNCDIIGTFSPIVNPDAQKNPNFHPDVQKFRHWFCEQVISE